jgi:ribonuclease T2
MSPDSFARDRARPGRVARTCLIALCLIAGSAKAAEPAQMDSGWTLTLEWSPEHCHRHRASKERQCLDPHHFILSRLQWQSTGAASDCASAPMPPALLDQVQIEIPDRELVRRMWSVDGACSGLTASEYAVQLGRAARRVTVPSELRSLSGRLETDAQQLFATLSPSNPGLLPEAMAPRCRGRYLAELRFCLDASYAFTACPADVVTACPDAFVVRGPAGRASGRQR